MYPTRALCFTLADYQSLSGLGPVTILQPVRADHDTFTHYLLTGEGACDAIPEGYDWDNVRKRCRCQLCQG